MSRYITIFFLGLVFFAPAFALAIVDPTNIDSDNVGLREERHCTDAELILNGGFEDPALRTEWDIIPFTNENLKWLGYVLPANADDVGRVGLEIQRGVFGYLSHNGSYQHAEMDGDHPTHIFQDIPTIPGKEYSLSYYFSPRPGTSAVENQLEVSVGDAVVGSHSGEGGENTNWTLYTHTFVASSDVTRVSFTEMGPDDSGSSGGVGSLLDDVSLRCVGDPQVEVPPQAPSSGGGGTSYTYGCTNPAATNYNPAANSDDSTCIFPLPGEVLGVSTEKSETPPVDDLSSICLAHTSEIIRYGADNNLDEVKDLQRFLNKALHVNLFVSGIYNFPTRLAVQLLDLKHAGELLLPWAVDPEATRDHHYWLFVTRCGELDLD